MPRAMTNQPVEIPDYTPPEFRDFITGQSDRASMLWDALGAQQALGGVRWTLAGQRVFAVHHARKNMPIDGSVKVRVRWHGKPATVLLVTDDTWEEISLAQTQINS